MSDLKKCSKCEKTNSVNNFGYTYRDKNKLKSWCKTCLALDVKHRGKTLKGKLKTIYNNQVTHSKTKGFGVPTYTKEEFVNRYKIDLNYIRHYYSWVISNYSKKYSPSFDRKDDYKGYSFDNIQVMYWFENSKKGSSDIRNGSNNKLSKAVIGTDIKTGKNIEFHSAAESGRNGFHQGCVSRCCLGLGYKHKGYTWEYKNKLL